jgi:hypothetical protein
MYSKGRNIDVVGEENGKSKLTTSQVIEIKKKFKQNSQSKRSIAREFGISPSAIFCIAWGQTWKHVEV